MCGHPLEHRGRALLRLEPRRQDDQTLRGDGGVLRVGAGHTRVGDLVAHFHLGHARADGGHGAARLEPERQRQVELVEAAALVDVDVVEPRRVDLDDRFAWLGRGLGHVLVLERLGTAGSVDANGLHRGDLRERIRVALRIIAPAFRREPATATRTPGGTKVRRGVARRCCCSLTITPGELSGRSPGVLQSVS